MLMLYSSRSILSKSKCLLQIIPDHITKNSNKLKILKSNTVKSCLFSSNTDDLVITKIDPDTPLIANVILNRPPVNALSLEMCVAIKDALTNLEKNNPKVQSVILSSSNSKVFSAGLDILTELYQPDPARLIKFWTSFQDMFVTLYLSKVATIAALDGTAVAGGCMIAMSCDYRIISEDSMGIGLNETQLGIAAPKWMSELMVRTIGNRQTELALVHGYVFDPKEAFQIDLIDETSDDVMARAKEQALVWAKIPKDARIASKLSTRQKFVDEFMEYRDEDLEFFCNFILQDAVQENIGKYITSLKKRK